MVLFYLFFCTRVGLLSPGANQIAVKIIIIIKERVCLLKAPTDLQMLFEAVAELEA
jgi:hypothetical protein